MPRSTKPPAPTEDEIAALLRASRELVHIAARSMAHVDEIVTLPQYRVLLQLRGQERSGAQLAEVLGVNPSTVVRMADRLETKGLIERRRKPTDRRVIQLALTDAGRDLVDGVTRQRVEEITAVLAPLSTGQRAGLVDYLALLEGGSSTAYTDDEAWPL